MEVRDPRCVDGDCLFPACSCEFPPHEEPPSWWDNDLKVLGALVPFSMAVAAAVVFAWFYAVNELL